MSEPRARASGFHHHVCPGCWHIWSHDGSTLKTEADVEAAHKCPDCGRPYADGYARTESECRKLAETKDAAALDPFTSLLRALTAALEA